MTVEGEAPEPLVLQGGLPYHRGQQAIAPDRRSGKPSEMTACSITFHANIPRLAGGHIRNPAWMVAPNRRSFEIEPMSYCCAAALVNGARCRVPARQERQHLVKTGAAASVRHSPAV